MKQEKALKLLEACKEHNGPVTPKSMELLENLTEKEVLTEVRYIRATVNPSIRERYKMTNGKFCKLTKVELIQQVRMSLCPSVGSGYKNDLSDLFHDLQGCKIDLKIILVILKFSLAE